ncbi:hypothetical protein NM688_g2172 [Phlebia brevispora]|uniref:Uncharacterized protein n=1 Tax=Phlebia brevispora TaxID=194682 RepID=A0ACC1T9Q8_9APHY|nr:hypothetical protein NM688_g2172 [Phlebia brevispora]
MWRTNLLLVLALIPASFCGPVNTLQKRGNVSFADPRTNNGSFLDNAGDGFSEPLNVVISGTSSPAVLTDEGFIGFAGAVGFAPECLGAHLGGPQSADLGDGNGFQNQTFELREDFGNFALGTCIEQLLGGNHLRLFRQNGSLADTGALFLAVSLEMGLLENHTIAENGYDVGRDNLVKKAVGLTSFNGTTYNTTAQNLTGVMPTGNATINHGIAVDGNAVLLIVEIVDTTQPG